MSARTAEDATVRPQEVDTPKHVVCCLDFDRALCGVSRAGAPPAEEFDEDEPSDCIVCDDLWQHYVCPLFGRCV